MLIGKHQQGDDSSSGVVLPFMLDNVPVYGKILQLHDLNTYIASLEKNPILLSRCLGEMLAAAIIMANDLKEGANVTLQIHSSSAIKLMVAHCSHDGVLKAYADTEIADISKLTFKDIAIENAAMAITVDYSTHAHQYQSMIELDNRSVSSTLEAYFEKSAQSPTYFKVFSGREKGRVSCGAVMLQAMPVTEETQHDEEISKDDWHRMGLLLSTVEPAEILSQEMSPESMLKRLFAEDTIRVFPKERLTFALPAARARMERALISLGVKSCRELLKKGPIEMTCEYTGKEEIFDEEDLEKLFDKKWCLQED